MHHARRLCHGLAANRGSQNRLWRNDGQGVFPVSPAATLPLDQGPSYGFTVADINGHRALDLLVVNQGAPDRLLRNNGLGVFTDISATHLPQAAPDSLAATFADMDDDGDADLVVAAGRDGLRLYHNDGQGQFTEATATHVPPLDAYGIQVVTGDVDVDGLATASLTRTDPVGTPQTVDLLVGLADGEATHDFTPTLAGTYTASVTVTDTQGETTTRQLAFAVETADDTAPAVRVAVETPTPGMAPAMKTAQRGVSAPSIQPTTTRRRWWPSPYPLSIPPSPRPPRL